MLTLGMQTSDCAVWNSLSPPALCFSRTAGFIMEARCPARTHAPERVEDSSGPKSLFRVGEILLMCPQEEWRAEFNHVVWSFTRFSKDRFLCCSHWTARGAGGVCVRPGRHSDTFPEAVCLHCGGCVPSGGCCLTLQAPSGPFSHSWSVDRRDAWGLLSSV